MTRPSGLLALVAVAGIAAAMIAALATRPVAPRPTGVPSRPPMPRTQPPARSPAPGAGDGAMRVAVAYALTARNWDAAHYAASWRAQIGLSTGRYRRALIAARPTDAQMHALRLQRAASSAELVAARRTSLSQNGTAIVRVVLAEVTSAAGERAVGRTINAVRLRRIGRRWRVVAWTVIPGG
jgi:hypothetical protein